MDTLHTLLGVIRGEVKARERDHLGVFREFLGHLDRLLRPKPEPDLPTCDRIPPPQRRSDLNGRGALRH